MGRVQGSAMVGHAQFRPVWPRLVISLSRFLQCWEYIPLVVEDRSNARFRLSCAGP